MTVAVAGDCVPWADAYIITLRWSDQRWIMNYAPDVFMGGVGQSTTNSEIYGSPQIGAGQYQLESFQISSETFFASSLTHLLLSLLSLLSLLLLQASLCRATTTACVGLTSTMQPGSAATAVRFTWDASGPTAETR